MLHFRGMELSGIGRRCNLPDRQWATLALTFEEGDDGHIRSVEIVPMVAKRPDATMSELQEGARTEAIAILEAALATLRGSSLHQLEAETLRNENGD